MTTPGRAVRIVMRQRLAARSIKIFGTDAVSSFFFSRSRILAVFGEQLAEFFFAGIPLRAPVFVDGDAQTDWIGFLAHNYYSSDKVILMWQLRLRIGPAEPRALGVKPLERRRRAGHRFLDAQRFRLELVVVLRVGDGGLQRLGHEPRAFARHDREHRLRLQRGQSLNLPHHSRAFSARTCGRFS